MAQVIIPSALRAFTNQQARLEIPGSTVGEIFTQLTTRFPDLSSHLLNEQGQLRKFVNVFVDEEEIRQLQKEATPVRESTEVSIVPSIAGG